MSKGSLGILNVGTGDTKLSFDKSNPAERARAAKIVEDMLKRGYAILVQIGDQGGEPIYRRAKAFDPETCEYIIAGGPDEVINVGELTAPGDGAGGVPMLEAHGRRHREHRVKAERTRAVSVSRSAGG